MKRLVQYLIGTIFTLSFFVFLAFAGGYQLNEHGARATGMGGAFVAQASDPSAIYYNPAGLAFQKGINVMGGGTFIFPATTFKPADARYSGLEVKQEAQVYFPPNLYGTYAFNDQLVIGLGVFTPFGLGSQWDKEWIGKRLAVKSEIQTFYFNPTIAYKITDQISIGAGASLVYARVNMTKRVPAFSAITPFGPYLVPTTSASDGTVELDANATEFNYNFGVLYKPIEELSLGASFRAETKINFSGTAKFTNMQASAPYFPGGDGKATLPMPMNIQVGASYDVMPTLTVEGDFQYVKWSSYKELTIDMPVGPTIATPPPALGGFGTIALQGPSTKAKNWDDGYLFRFGVEYKYSRDLTIRGGVVYDITPQPASKMEPMLPDANRIDPSIGLGYKITDQLSVDFVYMAVLFQETKSYYSEPGTTPGSSTPFWGTYSSTAHLVGFDISYSF